MAGGQVSCFSGGRTSIVFVTNVFTPKEWSGVDGLVFCPALVLGRSNFQEVVPPSFITTRRSRAVLIGRGISSFLSPCVK